MFIVFPASCNGPLLRPPNLLVPQVHLGSSAHRHVASSESPSSAGPYAAVRNPPTAGPSPRRAEAQRRLHTHGVGAVVSQVSICVRNQCGFPVLQHQMPQVDPDNAQVSSAPYGPAAQFHLPVPRAVTFSTGGVLPVLSLLTSPSIKLLRLRRRSHGPALGHHYFFGGDTAIAGPASPPLDAPLGPSSGTPLGTLLRARRPADCRTPPAQSVLLRRRVLGRVGEEEF
ncbi:hypothetical protein NDU88_005195 [Pleurodeles waltl]|uniref:Uncharacterized protein n=1 Tax=Pleurodeles waltl TaxID=8319 RepID=A0AAV7WX68_PLEWA|nr:hypothetical protein NDU88_005195 [Pleurodeles waltl]